MPTQSLSIAASADDAWQRTDGVMDLTGINIILDNADEYAIFRFQLSDDIPQYSVINTATPAFYIASTAYDDPDERVYVEKASNSAQPTTSSYNISSRTFTTEYEVWSDTGIGAGMQNGPSLVDVFQELIDAYDLSAGDYVSVILHHQSSSDLRIRPYDYGEQATLYLDWTAPPTGFDLKIADTPLGHAAIAAAGDILLAKVDDAEYWMEVQSVTDPGSDYFTYDVTLEDGSAGTIPRGAAVVNLGQSGDGWVELVYDDDNALSMIRAATHAGAPWSSITEKVRLGNLQGFDSYSYVNWGLGVTDRIMMASGAQIMRTTGAVSVLFDGNYLKFKVTSGVSVSNVGTPNPVAVLDVEQALTSGAIAVVRLEQLDTNERFIDFVGTKTTSTVDPSNYSIAEFNGDGSVDAPRNASGDPYGWSFTGMVKVYINGDEKWVPYYSEQHAA